MNENNWSIKWSKDQIKAMLLEQFQAFIRRDIGIEREQLDALAAAAGSPHAVIISGLRRVGKSTLLAQYAHRLGQGQFYYLNFEDERFLGFSAENANDLFQILVELFGERRIFIIDEIQNIPGWEHFVRRFMDMDYKFFITGSNASLLSRELGSRLTGRYIPFELFPFSFLEYQRFKGFIIPNLRRMTTLEHAGLNRALDEYLEQGGVPEPLKYPGLTLHRTLYDDVLYRDIATRYHIEEVGALKELAYYLMSNPANPVSYNKLKAQLRLGSVNTVKNYIEYMENSWLIFPINVYDFSLKRQQIALKKIYAIDTGLAKAVGFSFSSNYGRLLENLVFLALRRKSKEIYYFTTPAGHEVDFFLPGSGQLIQVSQNINQPKTFEREIRALFDAMAALKLSKGLLLSGASREPIREAGKVILVKSVAEWLLG